MSGQKKRKVPQVDEIELKSCADFHAQYIANRKPVKLVNSSIPHLDIDAFKIRQLSSHLHYDGRLQVEKKFAAGFGSSQDRIKMTLDDLITKFSKGDDDLYLTTQYEFDDPERQLDNSLQEAESDEDEHEDTATDDIVAESENLEEESDDESNTNEFNTQVNESKSNEIESEAFDNFSDTSSIDMNNLHDDYEDEDEEEEDEEEEDMLTIDGLSISAEEAKLRVRELLQPPLCNLATTSFPIVPEIFKQLVPQQINLWMGYSATNKPTDYKINEEDEKSFGLGKYIPGEKTGTSSGLHHDHADNLYVLVSGSKRFTLFSPSDGQKLATVGTIYKIFNSGIIDYQIDENAPNWKHIRDDGAIVEEITHWLLEQEDVDETVSKKLLKQIDEELTERKRAKKTIDKNTKLDPPNFSKIPPALLHIEEFSATDKEKIIEFANKHFPELFKLDKLTVWLKPGDMLYLPAGWFHEVSSFGSTSSSGDNLENVHIALNYWFMPPNDETKVYKDNYWYEDWLRTEASLKLVKTGEIVL